MFNGYNQPTYESDAGRDNNLKKSGHPAPWNYSQSSYYNNSDLQQANSAGAWQQKLSYPSVAPKCSCVQCQQGTWYHKEVEPAVPSSNPDMMVLGPGIGGGGNTDYSMETYPRAEAFMRNNVPVSKKFPSCSYPSPNPQMYSHRLPNIKQNVSEFTNFDRNSDQYMRMFEASSYGRKPADSRPKYWDSVNGAFYPPQQYQYAPPCRYPPYNPPFYYPNSSQSQSYQHPQQNGIQQYYGLGPNPMRQMEVAQPMAHNYLKQDNSKISPLRLMRKKKLAESVGQPSPPRMTQVTDNTPALDVRRFLATWADEDEESPSVPQMVVLDCQDINAEQAELLRLYENSTAVRLVQEPCIEQVSRSEPNFIPSKSTDDVLEMQSVVSDAPLPSAVPADYSQEAIPPVTDVKEPTIECQQADESNGSPLPSPASTANSQDSLPVLADLPTSEYRKNKFLDYDQQSFPLLPTNPTVTETVAVNSCRPQTVVNPTEEIEKNEKKNNRKRSRKPTIKFSIQKSHDLKISLRVLNDSKSDLEQDAKNKIIDRKDESDARDLITVSLDGGEDDTVLHDLSQKRAKKLKRRRLLEQTYSVSSEDHCNDVTSDGFQVEESVDSAKIKLTFKRRKGEREQEEIPKKRKKAKRIKEERDNKPKNGSTDWKAPSPEEPPAADTTTDFYGQPPAHPSEQKLDTPVPSPTQISISDFPENVTSSPITNENIPTFSAFDQPDSSHQNNGIKNAISQNSNTSSPKISSSCHITSPRTSTDSIEKELQAIWSGRGNDIKFNEDDRITSNDNVVDFYTEDIATGPINVDPLKHKISETLSISPSRKDSSPTTELTRNLTNDCIEKTEGNIQVTENLSEDISNSLIPPPDDSDNFDTQGRDEYSLNSRSPIAMSMALSPCYGVSTITDIVVDNSSNSPNLRWEEPILRKISPISTTDDNVGNESGSSITYEDTNGTVEQTFKSNHSEESNVSSSLINSKIVCEASQQPVKENEILNAELSSAINVIVTKNQNIFIKKHIVHTCVEKTILGSDKVLVDSNSDNELINDDLNKVKLPEEAEPEITPCVKSPTSSFDKKIELLENELCTSTKFLNKLSFDGELNNASIVTNAIQNLEKTDVNKKIPKNNFDPIKPNIELAKSPFDIVFKIEKERLGPRTPEGSPNFLNSSVSPTYSEFCESPFNRNSHDCSVETVYEPYDTSHKIVHSSPKELSLIEKGEENEFNSFPVSMVVKSGSEVGVMDSLNLIKKNSTDIASDFKSPLKSTDFNNENEESQNKSSMTLETSIEEVGKIDHIDLNKRKYEDEVNTIIPPSSNRKEDDEISRSLDSFYFEPKIEDLEVYTTDVQGRSEECGTLPLNLHNTNVECVENSPVDFSDLNYETKKSNLEWDINNKNDEEKNASLDSLDLSNTKEKYLVSYPSSSFELNHGKEITENSPINLDNADNQGDIQTFVTTQDKSVIKSPKYSVQLKAQVKEQCAILPLDPLNSDKEGQKVSSGSIGLNSETVEELKQNVSPLSSIDLSNKKEENGIGFSLESISDWNEKGRESNSSLTSVEEKQEDITYKRSDPKHNEFKDLSENIISKLTLCEEMVDVPNSDHVTNNLTISIASITLKPSNEIKSHHVTIVENETKKTDRIENYDSSHVHNENQSSGDEDNLSENISKAFVTFNCISPLSSPHGIEDKTQSEDIEADSQKYLEQVHRNEQFNNNDSMESIELEADENANIIIGVEELSDLDDGNDNEYILEKVNDDVNLSDNLPSPSKMVKSGCNDGCIETNLTFDEESQRSKLEEGEIIEEEEYIVVADNSMCPIMMEDGVLIEISDDEPTCLDIEVQDIPLPPGEAPKENYFDYRQWLENNCNRENLPPEKCVSPFTSEVLGMFRNPSPPGTPRMVMSPASPTTNEVTRLETVITEVEVLDEEAGLPDDAEFQHVMENCMANARKFLSGEIDDKTSDNINEELEENVNRKDVLLSSFETHSDLEMGCDASSAQVTIAFSPFNTAIASETLPVDNWPYLEEEVPSSPHWPCVIQEDIPLHESEDYVESSLPNTSNMFEKESKCVRDSNRLPRIRRRTLDTVSSKKVRTKKFLSERELNESDNDFEIFRDFKCHLSLDRLALKDVIDKKAVSSRTRKKRVESEVSKGKPEDFKGKNWQPKVVLSRMSLDKESFPKIQPISEKAKVDEIIENIPEGKEKGPSKKVPPEPQFEKSQHIYSPHKGPSKLTFSNYIARKRLSHQMKCNSIVSESQEKNDLVLKSHNQSKTQTKMEINSQQNDKKEHKDSEKPCNKIKVAKVDRVDTHKNNNNKMKHGFVKKRLNEPEICQQPEFDVVEMKCSIGQNNDLNNKIIKVSDSSSKKCKEDRNYRIDKSKSRSVTKKSSHKKEVLKKVINLKSGENSKQLKPSLPIIEDCKSYVHKEPTSFETGIDETLQKTEKCFTSNAVVDAKYMSSTSIAVDDESDHSEPWICAVCGFDDLKEQQRHIQEHAFHCQGCHLAFVSEDHFIKHLSKKHEDIRKIHHCLLCELSFETIESYNEHLETREHKHLEEVEKSTIHTLFTLLCGEPCPVLGPVTEKPEWLPNQAGTVHFYHQATPLSLATQYWKKRQSSTVNKQ